MNSVPFPLEQSLKVCAPAKINLHLEVLGLRKDGFHELAMVMQSIDLFDEIEITKTNDEQIRLNSDNSELSNGDENLIVRAANLLRSRSELSGLGALIHLRKNIPIGAGLAGGSSDGAATLVGLNSLWGLDFSNNQLENMAAELGSDVPFCISGGAQLCFGRGECLEPLDKSNTTLAIVLVKDPSAFVSTPWAYSRYKEINQSTYLSNEVDFHERRMALKEASWLRPLTASNPPPLINDLQDVVAPATPAVDKALKFLRSLKGTLSVAMSGSGPSCFAIFSDLDQAKVALEENHQELQKQGLEGWCCGFSSKGVRFVK